MMNLAQSNPYGRQIHIQYKCEYWQRQATALCSMEMSPCKQPIPRLLAGSHSDLFINLVGHSVLTIPIGLVKGYPLFRAVHQLHPNYHD